MVILSPSACSSIYGTKNKQNKTVKYKKDKKILTKQSINATHFKVGSTYKVCRRCEKVLDMGNYILLTDFLGLPIMPMHFKSLVYVFTLHNQNNKKNKTKTIPFCFHHRYLFLYLSQKTTRSQYRICGGSDRCALVCMVSKGS